MKISHKVVLHGIYFKTAIKRSRKRDESAARRTAMSDEKRYGCPKCGSTERFREINVAFVDFFFNGFKAPDEQHPEPFVADWENSDVDYESAEPIAQGRYQCSECETHFEVPAEIGPDGKPVPGTGEIVPDDQVQWRAQ